MKFKTLCTLLALFLTVSPVAAYALGLDEAKAKGLVGEQTDGYLGSVTPSAEVSKLVAEINSKRKVEYERIARSNATSLTAVEQLAAKKAIENTQSGYYIRSSDGSWKKK